MPSNGEPTNEKKSTNGENSSFSIPSGLSNGEVLEKLRELDEDIKKIEGETEIVDPQMGQRIFELQTQKEEWLKNYPEVKSEYLVTTEPEIKLDKTLAPVWTEVKKLYKRLESEKVNKNKKDEARTDLAHILSKYPALKEKYEKLLKTTEEKKSEEKKEKNEARAKEAKDARNRLAGLETQRQELLNPKEGESGDEIINTKARLGNIDKQIEEIYKKFPLLQLSEEVNSEEEEGGDTSPASLSEDIKDETKEEIHEYSYLLEEGEESKEDLELENITEEYQEDPHYKEKEVTVALEIGEIFNNEDFPNGLKLLDIRFDRKTNNYGLIFKRLKKEEGEDEYIRLEFPDLKGKEFYMKGSFLYLKLSDKKMNKKYEFKAYDMDLPEEKIAEMEKRLSPKKALPSETKKETHSNREAPIKFEKGQRYYRRDGNTVDELTIDGFMDDGFLKYHITDSYIIGAKATLPKKTLPKYPFEYPPDVVAKNIRYYGGEPIPAGVTLEEMIEKKGEKFEEPLVLNTHKWNGKPFTIKGKTFYRPVGEGEGYRHFEVVGIKNGVVSYKVVEGRINGKDVPDLGETKTLYEDEFMAMVGGPDAEVSKVPVIRELPLENKSYLRSISRDSWQKLFVESIDPITYTVTYKITGGLRRGKLDPEIGNSKTVSADLFFDMTNNDPIKEPSVSIKIKKPIEKHPFYYEDTPEVEEKKEGEITLEKGDRILMQTLHGTKTIDIISIDKEEGTYEYEVIKRSVYDSKNDNLIKGKLNDLNKPGFIRDLIKLLERGTAMKIPKNNPPKDPTEENAESVEINIAKPTENLSEIEGQIQESVKAIERAKELDVKIAKLKEVIKAHESKIKPDLSSLENLPTLNQEKINKLKRASKIFAIKALEMYIPQSETMLAALSTYKSNDYSSIGNWANSLEEWSKNIGAEKLAAYLKKLEDECKAVKPQDDLINSYIQAVKEESSVVSLSIEKELSDLKK